MNEQDLRDCFAMFAVLRRSFDKDFLKEGAEGCYAIADAMLEARKPKEEVGITAVKRRKKSD